MASMRADGPRRLDGMREGAGMAGAFSGLVPIDYPRPMSARDRRRSSSPTPLSGTSAVDALGCRRMDFGSDLDPRDPFPMRRAGPRPV